VSAAPNVCLREVRAPRADLLERYTRQGSFQAPEARPVCVYAPGGAPLLLAECAIVKIGSICCTLGRLLVNFMLANVLG
jgi:hypothetical protein